MRKYIFILATVIILIACEKSDDIADIELPPDIEILPDGFSKKILDGIFVKSIAFDNSGNAWVGTFKQGLIKYNDDEIRVYNSKNSIIPDSSVIYDIQIDSKNNIWFSCEGLMKFDDNTFTYYNSSNSPVPEDFVPSIAIDSKDNIWFSSSRVRQGGIVKYDGINWTVYTPDNSDLPLNFVRSIAIDTNDNIWLAQTEYVNQSCLVKIANDDWTVYAEADLGFTPFYFGNIEFNSANELCGAIDYALSGTITNNGPQVFIFDGSLSKKLQFDSVSNIKSITVDNQDNIWCWMHGGFAVYDGQDWIINDSEFISPSIFVIEQALDNKMWFGTGDGIYIKD